MVLEWRGCIWDFSWCLMQSILIRANNRNNAGWVKPLGVFMVRMLGVIAWPQEQSAWWIFHLNSLQLFPASLYRSASFFLLSWYTQSSSPSCKTYDHKQPFQVLETRWSFLSWFSISQGRNRFIHLGLDVHFWSNLLWLGLGYKEKFWAIQLVKGPVVTKACCANACSYRKSVCTSHTKQRHAHRAAGSSDLSSDLFWWLKVNI